MPRQCMRRPDGAQGKLVSHDEESAFDSRLFEARSARASLLLRQRLVLSLAQRDDREPPDAHQRRVGEELIGFDLL